MEEIRGKILKPQKVVIYGPEGIGKSYLASKFPNPIFIDTEGSTYHMDVVRTKKPSSWTMLMQQVQYYKANSMKYDTLIIDTADWAERLCKEHVCNKANKSGIEEFGYGKGYTYLEEEFGRLLNALTELIDDAGMNVVMVAHAQLRKFEQPNELGSYDRWEMKLEKKVFPLVKEWADLILFANYEVVVVNIDNQGAAKGKNKAQGGKRVMYTTHHPCWDAKNRHDLLDKIELHYSEIAHCIPSRGGAAVPQDKPQQQAPPPETPQQETKQEPPKQPEPNLPRALLDLMKQNNVTVREIQRAVASRGYYPIDTPVENYDPGFIEGVLVGAWGQVFQMIEDNRNEIPF